jgi:flagella basal body P-ring formation protein FlgA
MRTKNVTFMKVVIMDIALKYRIVEKIIQSNDETLLNEIKSLVGLSEGDFWGELPTEVKQAVIKAKAELDRGEGISHAQVMAEMKDRYLNR